MTRLALLLAVVACGSGSLQPDTGHMADPAQQPAAPPRTGRHAARVELVAVTDDGTAAISQDAMGGTRLWPTLDGSREPIIVRLGRVLELAIGRTATGFVVAGLDEAGGAELVALAHNGAVEARTRLAPDPTIVRMQIRGGDLLALRADQTIEIIDASGTQRARLEPAAGARILGLHARGGRALAVLHQRDGSFNGVWIGDFAWGAVTRPLQLGHDADAGELRPDAGALSPDGRYLAVPTPLLTRVISLDTGLFERSPAVPRGDQNVGFVDDDTLVMYSDHIATWFEGTSAEGVGSKPGVSVSVGGGLIVSGVGDGLELRAAADRAKYLGYRIGELVHARVSPTGITVGGGQHEILELDRELRPKTTIKLPPGGTVVDMVWLDDHHVLATHAISQGATFYMLSVIDVRNGVTVQSLSSPVTTRLQRYQPATELLAISDSNTSYLLRRTPVTSKFETWYRVEYDSGDLHVLDPSISGGVVAVNIRTNTDNTKTVVERIRANDLVVGTPISSREVFTHDGFFLGLDARGRIVVGDGDALVVYDGADQVLRIRNVLTGESALAAMVSADIDRQFGNLSDAFAGRPPPPPRRAYVVATADHIALVEGERVALFTTAGTLRWEISGPFLHDIGWMGGELVAHFAGGLAKLDLETGALIAPTCGWSFGLSDTPGRDLSAGESICDAP